MLCRKLEPRLTSVLDRYYGVVSILYLAAVEVSLEVVEDVFSEGHVPQDEDGEVKGVYLAVRRRELRRVRRLLDLLRRIFEEFSNENKQTGAGFFLVNKLTSTVVSKKLTSSYDFCPEHTTRTHPLKILIRGTKSPTVEKKKKNIKQDLIAN